MMTQRETPQTTLTDGRDGYSVVVRNAETRVEHGPFATLAEAQIVAVRILTNS